jgi:glycosyltransferase involved in cell wall biosynthesis
MRDKEIDGYFSVTHTTHWVSKVLSFINKGKVVNFVGYSPSVDPSQSKDPRVLLEWLNFKLFIGDSVVCRVPRTRDVIEKLPNTDVSIIHGVVNRDKIKRAKNTPDIRERYGIKKQDKFLVFVGRLAPIKDPVSAVDVVARLSSDYQLVMIGDGPEYEKVKKKIDDLKVNQKVTLAGELSHSDTLQAIAASDGLVLTSEAEAYPTVVFEQLALGGHVFVPAIGILPEIDHPRLHLVKDGSFDTMVRKIEFDNRTNIDETVLSKYSIQRYTEDVLDTFESILTNDCNQNKR